MAEANQTSAASAVLVRRLNRALYSLEHPIAQLPVAGYPRPGQRRQRPAAVLVALLEYPSPEVVLTVRAHHLDKHPGQIAFPGGARASDDRGVVDTALREAEEETGIDRNCFEPKGLLGRYDTITGYRMTAVVATVRGPVEFQPDRNEVDEVFTVPLNRVADPDAYQHQQVKYQAQDYQLLTLQHPEHNIWGATAALLYQLGQRLQPDRDWREH